MTRHTVAYFGNTSVLNLKGPIPLAGGANCELPETIARKAKTNINVFLHSKQLCHYQLSWNVFKCTAVVIAYTSTYFSVYIQNLTNNKIYRSLDLTLYAPYISSQILT